jgi:hypothetical protein
MVSEDLLKSEDIDGNFSESIVTHDKTWFYGYKPKTK